MTARINKVDGDNCGSIEGITFELGRHGKTRQLKFQSKVFLARIANCFSIPYRMWATQHYNYPNAR